MKIEHVALWAKNIDKLKSFYEKYFNAKSNSKYTNPRKQFSSYFLSFDSDTRLEIRIEITV
jgi:lactoylglutathione lyase